MKRKATAKASSGRPKKRSRSGANIPANLRAFGSETKSIDTPGFVVNLNTTGSVTGLNFIRAGNSFFNRIGRRVELKNITLSCSITPLRTVAQPDYVRVMVIYDRQTNGAAPVLADILQSVDQAGAATNTAFSGINLNNRDRFKIFIDERITLPSTTVTAGVITNPGFVDPVKTTFNIKRFAKLGREITQYKADSAPAVVGDISTGGLFLLAVGSIAAGTEGFNMVVESRVRYNDK